MTREEIHKLIAGYATGTLTAAERQALFAAALDDQELFDELAQEQDLKELLEEPGVRQRLIASLEHALEPAPRKQAWWEKRQWTWAAAATVAAVLLGVYLVQPPEPKRLAVVLPQPPPMAVPPVPFLPPPPEDQTAPPLPAPAAVERAQRGVTPPLPQPAVQKAADQISANRPEPAPKEEVAAQAPPLPPAPAAAPRAAGTLIPPQALIAGGRGGGGGRAPASGLLEKPAAEFGFTYSVTAEGRLRIVPSGSGFLSMSAGGLVQVSNRPLAAGSTTEFLLPVGVTSATVVFSAQPIADSILNIVKSPLDAPAGRVSDPSPTPASRLELVISVEPR